ncbi:hypothetical protein L873DRAFT_634979 [Choiromyces venosus 120613-1]|uniref:Uncharacterized protein n=1 Tax=Choiromyces venosus 120613-1 TaxID=1336337 RepID=A0A3N4JTF4_9PEZI|nr:hypothetical protein L873DRAFT_634979 [Choiromyces venosus 120613-1]
MTWNIYKLQSLVQPSEFPKHSIPALIPNTNTIIPSTNILIPNTNIPIPNTNHHSDNAFPTFLTTLSNVRRPCNHIKATTKGKNSVLCCTVQHSTA